MKKRTLALFLAGAMALGLVGCGPKEADPTPTPEPLVYDEEKTADVIVVGAGGAGLAAAISAADAGAESVIVVEKLGKTGGSLNYTSGSMSGAETIIQQLDGIEDTVAEMLEDIHQGLYAKARKNLEDNTYPCATLEEVREKMESRGGFAKTMWCGELACELRMKEEAGVSSRCIPFQQERLGEVCACCGKPAKHMVYWGVAY